MLRALAASGRLALGSEGATLWAGLLYMGTVGPVIFLCLYRVLSTPRLQGLLIVEAATRQSV